MSALWLPHYLVAGEVAGRGCEARIDCVELGEEEGEVGGVGGGEGAVAAGDGVVDWDWGEGGGEW